MIIINRKDRRKLKADNKKASRKDGASFLSGASHVSQSIDAHNPELANAASKIADVATGREHLQALVESAFNAKYGEQMKVAEANFVTAEREHANAVKELKVLRELKAQTSERRPDARSVQNPNVQEEPDVPFGKWQSRHKIEASGLLLFLPAALGASFITAYSNLIGTGLPVFIEQPLTAVTLAAIAPATGLAVKLMSSMFRTDRAHRRFTWVLNGGAMLCALSWVVLFADQFHGLNAGSIGSGLFDEPTLWEKLKPTLFVFATLATEISVGAVLANRLDAIARSYAPERSNINPEFEFIVDREKLLAQHVENLAKLEAEAKGRRDKFRDALAMELRTALLAYDGRRDVNNTPDFI